MLTARLWMNAAKQKKYEQDLALFIDYVWKQYKLKTVFVTMAWNEKEESDEKVGKRMQKYIKNKKIFTISSVKSSEGVKKLIAEAKFAICTRMHSAIFSTIVKTPFITIAYEHKTEGFLKLLGLEKWNIDIQDFSFIKLKEKFDDLLKNRQDTFTDKLYRSHLKILKKEDKLSEIIKLFSRVGSIET